MIGKDDDVYRCGIEQPLEVERWPRGGRAAVQTGNEVDDLYDDDDDTIIMTMVQ